MKIVSNGVRWAMVMALVGLPGVWARAEVVPHALFSEHAVLQQQTDVPIWGTAGDGERVTVEFQDQTVSTTATGGRWKVVLKPLRAGGPFNLVIRGPANTVTRSDILVGEVWLCAGQSNMGWGLGGSEKPEQIASHADLPRVRLFAPPQDSQEHPKSDLSTQWEVCTPHSAYGFSAVGYYFGRDLHKSIDVPVGLIRAAVGGSFAHTWMPASYLKSDPQLVPLLDFWEQSKAEYRQRLEAYKANEPALRKRYEEALARAVAEGKDKPRPPTPPGDNPDVDHRRMTAANYNGMIHPLQPYAIRGALWYQGENDAGRPDRYRVTLPTMIRAWRETWGQGDFPFLIVQLPAYGRVDDPRPSRWALMRESQAYVAKTVANAGLIVTIDCGDAQNTTDIHPPHKEPVGVRAALAARALVYGQKVDFAGPVFQSMAIEGCQAVLTFANAGDGLIVRGDGPVTGFVVAGEDHRFVKADARIDGSRVVVSSDAVAAPVAVRYGWADYPICNLYNRQDLPAMPFRTDVWDDTPLAP